MLPADPDAVANDLQTLVDHVHRQLRDLEQLDMSELLSDDQTSEESEESKFRSNVAGDEAADGIRWALRTLYVRLQIYCEAFGLVETRRSVQTWRDQWPDAKLGETKPWSTSEADGRASPALDDILPIVDGLIVLLRSKRTEPAPTAADKLEYMRLEHCLRSIAKVIRERKLTPTSEADVQEALHSHLDGVFEDYTRTLTIAKPLLSFKPDGGVISLGAAIECKFVAAESEVATALHGLTEDLSGYAGSRDWTRFYTLIYMTEPFTTERHVARGLGISGNAGTWTTIVVTGPGARIRKKRSSGLADASASSATPAADAGQQRVARPSARVHHDDTHDP